MLTLSHDHLAAAGLPVAAVLPFKQAAPFLRGDAAPFASVLVALFPYGVEGEAGNLSRYARGEDYHLVARRRLEGAAAALGLTGCCYVDVSPFDEGRLAEAAGLGGVGRNGLLMSRELGSWCFVGTFAATEAVAPLPGGLTAGCTGCGACLRACPTGALGADGVDASRCLSALTQARRLTEAQEALLRPALAAGAAVWGCDVCQTVCPVNRGLGTTALPEFLQGRRATLRAEELAGLSDRAFRRVFADRAFSWRGVLPLRRNLCWAEGGGLCEKDGQG
ncbi:MAG: DUF1730 domain-containing protein [Clostridia bacterium]|nr:DUF1730 domain-containing protein [Clostridia bacterium]